jgi:hypothetical protein
MYEIKFIKKENNTFDFILDNNISCINMKDIDKVNEFIKDTFNTSNYFEILINYTKKVEDK